MNGTWKDIEKLEKDLWEAADNLRANSKLTSNDYFMPVLGVIFLRHAANRFAAAQQQIDADKAAGRMGKRKVIPEDYVRRRALWLPPEARYDWIMEQAATRAADLPGRRRMARRSWRRRYCPPCRFSFRLSRCKCFSASMSSRCMSFGTTSTDRMKSSAPPATSSFRAS